MTIAWPMLCTKRGLAFGRHQLAVQLPYQRIQGYIRETRNVPQLRVNCIGSEHFFQGALKEGQSDQYMHNFKWLRRERFPPAIIGRASRR
jgi:hypothetical protein